MMNSRIHTLRCALVVGMLALPPLQAQAASAGAGPAWPTRPVRILVPLTTGGAMDATSRSLAQKLIENLGQNVIVDNRPGAGAMVASEILASSAPDGHTLLTVSVTSVIHPLLYKSRFDLLRDFAPVSQITAQGYLMTVHPSLPAKTVLELVQYLKANPGKLNVASTGIGSPIHMTAELFQYVTGTKMVHIPYKGVSFPDMISGRIHVGFATVNSSLVHLQSGRLRPLAVTTPKRLSALPDLPTFAEAGVKNMVVVNWYGIAAPGRTPPALVERISAEIARAMQSPDVAKRLAAESAEAVGSSSSEFIAHIRAEHDQWSRVIKQAGIRGE